LHALVDRERERSPLHEQVVVGRGDVHVASLDRHLVLGVLHRPLDAQAQQVGQAARRRGHVPVLCDHDGEVDLGGQVAEQPPDCVEAAPRSADADQLVHV